MYYKIEYLNFSTGLCLKYIGGICNRLYYIKGLVIKFILFFTHFLTKKPIKVEYLVFEM